MTMQTTQTEASLNPFDNLTARQRQIAKAIALGKTREEIADDTQISTKTFDTHRAAVIDALGVRNNVELARLALIWSEVSL